MPYPLPLTRTEAYLAYKAGVIQQSDLKPSLAIPRNGIDAWLAYWTGLTPTYPVKNVGKNLFNVATAIDSHWLNYQTGKLINDSNPNVVSNFIEVTSGTTYTISGADDLRIDVWQYTAPDEKTGTARIVLLANQPHTFTPNTPWIRFAVGSGDAISVKNQFMLEAGSTATSFEPYTGEPLTLQEEEAYIAYLSGAANEYPEKCLRRVGAYLRYLISARWGRPDHPLNREELYLSLLKTQVIPSGDPSSDIEIDGTAKAAFQDVKMYGDTFQQSYTGKNLVRPAGTTGIIASYDAATGEYSVSKATSATWVWLTGFCPLSQTITSGTTITISRNVESSFNFWVRTYHPDNTYGSYSLGAHTLSQVITEDKDINRIVVMANSVPDNFSYSFKLQVEIGNEATSFEPYVGGVPSPNPDYPQQIQTVTGRQMVKVTGKNLNTFPYASGSSKTHRGVTFTANPDGSVTIKGTHDGSGTAIYYFRDFWDYNETDGVVVDANTTLTASITGGDGYGIRFIAEGYHPDETYDQLNTASTQTITTTAKATFNGRITVYAGFSSTEGVTVYPMLEKGSTATVYEPYSSNDYEINLGKNLFNRNDVVNGIPSATDGSIVSASSVGRTSGYIPVVPNTDYSHTGHPLGWATVAWYKADKSFIRREDNVTTIASPSEAAYARVSCAQDNLGTCQFEAGEPTNYAPYFTPIELCKLGTYQDYIWKDGEDWKIHKATNKITVDGSENWQYPDSGANYTFFQFSRASFRAKYGKAADFYASNTVVGFARADKFEQIIASAVNMRTEQGIGFTIEGAGWLRISVANTIATTIAAFKTWLSSHPTTIDYTLATPTDTTITDQALIAQLEALVVGGAEDGTTYIKVNATDPNLPGLLYVEAPKYE